LLFFVIVAILRQALMSNAHEFTEQERALSLRAPALLTELSWCDKAELVAEGVLFVAQSLPATLGSTNHRLQSLTRIVQWLVSARYGAS
jgi:hypothetical protein